MIQPNELRIRNLIYLHDTVVDVDIHVLMDIHIGVDGFSPIPLTPEILEKAGFDYDRLDQMYLSPIGIIKNTQTGFIIPDETGDNYLGYELKYLHQLQNLYFALTGEELSIEL